MSSLIIFSFFYNRANEVKKTITSLLEACPETANIILVNDGSTDDTLFELKKFAHDSRITIVDQLNVGFTKSLTTVIPKFLGKNKYLAIHGAGDTCDKNKYIKQLEYLESHTDIVALGCGHRLISESTGKTLLTLHGKAEADFAFLCNTVPFTHGTVIYRSSAFIAAGGYDSLFKCSQDWDLYFRLLNHGRIVRLDLVLYDKYLLKDGVSFKPAKKIEQIKYVEVIRSRKISELYFNEQRTRLAKHGINSTILNNTIQAQCKKNQYSLIMKREFELALEWEPYISGDLKNRCIQLFIKLLLNIFIQLKFPKK